MNDLPVNRWDVPVIRALDQIERLPGFAPDHVAWDHFSFSTLGLHRPMHRASIYAIPLGPPPPQHGLVCWTFTTKSTTRERAGFAVHSTETPRLIGDADLVRVLDVPMRSAIRARALINYALKTSLEEYNAHVGRNHPIGLHTLQLRNRNGPGNSGRPGL